jgi:hypothetical protein
MRDNEKQLVLKNVLIPLIALIAGTVVAAIFGAESLGVALTFGQIAFVAALTWVLLKR